MSVESITVEQLPDLHVALTGGGTGGHISPLVAVVERLRSRGVARFDWVGSIAGPEREAAASLDIPYHAVHTGKLRRYASLSTLVDVVRVPAGVIEATRVLRRIRPDVVFSSGGFAGVPAVIAARFLGIPSITHEQTAHLGLATRINSRFSDIVALSFPAAAHHDRMGRAQVVLTGNPVRAIVTGGDMALGLEAFGLSAASPLIYVTGGAQGAHAINQLVLKALPELLALAQIVHQTGPQSANGDYDHLVEAKALLPAEMEQRYRVVERVGNEIGGLYAATTLVIGRAGAGTVVELATVGLPSILIPLPGATEQVRNARVLVDAGAAVLLPQDEATPERLVKQVATLLGDPTRLAAMASGARRVAPSGAADRLADEIIKLGASKG